MGILAALVIIVVIGLLVRRISQRWPMPPWLEFFTTLGLAAFFSGFHLLRNVAIWQATVLVAGALGMIALYQFRVRHARAEHARRTTLAHRRSGPRARHRDSSHVRGVLPGTPRFPGSALPVAAARRSRGTHDGPPTRLRARADRDRPGHVLRLQPGSLRLTDRLRPEPGVESLEQQSTLTFSSLSYTLPNAYYYLVRPLSLAPVFPFLSFDGFRWPFQHSRTSTPNTSRSSAS